MKLSPKTPDWASKLVEEVCKEYKRALPYKIIWSNKERNGSSGYTMYDYVGFDRAGRKVRVHSYISIVAGEDEDEYKVVILHELAHWILAKRSRGHHSKRFWLLVVDLNKKYGNVALAYKRDGSLYYGDNTSISRVKADEVFTAALS